MSNLLHHIFGLSGSVMKNRGVNYVQVEPQVWCRGVDGYAKIEPQHTHIDIYDLKSRSGVMDIFIYI